MTKRRTLVFALPLLLWSCGHAKDGPSPAPSGVEPPVQPEAVCVEQLTTEVTLDAAALSIMPIEAMTDDKGLALPEVALVSSQDLTGAPVATPATFVISDDPRAPDESHVSWLSPSQLAFEVTPALALTPALYTLRVTNANGHAQLWPDALLAVPRPTLTTLEPELICGPKGATVVLTGSGLIQGDDKLPVVRARDANDANAEAITLPAPTLGECSALPGSAGLQSCSTLTLAIGADALAAAAPYAAYALEVQNPDPVGCHSTDTINLTVVPAPVLETIEPELACTAEGQTVLTLRGTGFLQLGDAKPRVTFDTQTFDAEVGGCEPVPTATASAQSCTTLTVTLAQDALPVGSYAVSVQNPAPADCQSSQPVTFIVVPPPTISTLDPGAVCDNGVAITVTLGGDSFISVDDGSGSVALPTVTVGDETFTNPTLDDCVTLDGLLATVRRCKRLTFTVPAGTFGVGSYAVTVQNPAPAACSSGATLQLSVVDPPTLSGVVPTQLCIGGGSLALSGTNFATGIDVSVGNKVAESVVVQSTTSLAATFGALEQSGVTLDLTVSYSDVCKATLPSAVTVVAGPQLFFADPPVSYNGVDTRVTLYGSGFSGALREVALRPSGTTDAPTTLSFSVDPARPNQLQAVVPAQTPAGTYDVILKDQTACDAILVGGIKVVDQITLELTSIVPPFGHTASTTGVTLYADPVAGGGLQPVPRLYLNPVGGGDASPIGAVTYVDASRVTALVPAGLAVGRYDVIAVNPDGAVGLLEDAFEITTAPPPSLEGITPGSIQNDAHQAVKVTGSDLRAPTASMRCRDTAGNETNPTIPVTSATASEVLLDVDASPYPVGAVCVIRITNDDGTYAEIPGLVITNPAQNLRAFTAGPQLATARRALGSASVRVTQAARFLYAIGGDDGTVAGAHASVEVAPVDLFGQPGAFFTQRNALSVPRSFVGVAAVQGCLYAVGGANADGVLASVERACVLDPADRPQIADLFLETSQSAGLGAGVWYYQVAALMPASHAKNPSGETLPSEPFPLLLPDLGVRKVTVKVSWSAVAGAMGYRVYRSPAADTSADALELLAEVASTATSYQDMGAATTSSRPLRLGATGTWHTLTAALATSRQGAGVAVAPDVADATKRYLFVVGGSDGGDALSSIESLTITLGANDAQTAASAFTTSSQSLAAKRWQLSLYSVGNESASYVDADTHFLYAGGGVAQDGSTQVPDVAAFEVQTGGTLGARVTVDTMQPYRAGYGYAVANNFLYAFGGNKAMPDFTVTSIRICADQTVQQCKGGPPELENWNNVSAHMLVARYLMGSTVESSFIYLVGGTSDTQAATTSTEYSNW